MMLHHPLRTQPSAWQHAFSRTQSSHHHQPARHKQCWRAAPAAAQATASTAAALGQQEVALQLTQPPAEYDYKADILPETLEVVQQQYPQLMQLVEEGNLVACCRPSTYQERRSDGYQEPQLIFILGTAHVSQQSAAEVAQLIAAVQPDAVVVELCKSRTGVLQAAAAGGGQQQQQQDSEQQHEEQEQPSSSLLLQRQQRWQQQWQDWQQQRGRGQEGQQQAQQQSEFDSLGAAAPAATSSASSSLEEESLHPPPPHYTSSSTRTSTSSTSSSSSNSSSLWSRVSSSMRRFQSAKASNPLSLSGPDPLSALARSASLGGQQAMLLRLLIAGQARKAADQLGVQPGGEFRAAAEAAAAVPGGQCCLVLGDRPIEITLSRAWEALSWQRRVQLLGDLMTAGMAMTSSSSSQQAMVLSQQQVEALRSDDAISGLFSALSQRYPELVAPLITERDLYLSWSLKRSKAVNGARVVVGCVGKGHLRGIVYALKHDQGNLRFKDLVGGKNSKQNRKAAAVAAVRRLVVELLLGAAVYAAWLAATSSSSSVGQ